MLRYLRIFCNFFLFSRFFLRTPNRIFHPGLFAWIHLSLNRMTTPLATSRKLVMAWVGREEGKIFRVACFNGRKILLYYKRRNFHIYTISFFLCSFSELIEVEGRGLKEILLKQKHDTNFLTPENFLLHSRRFEGNW